MAGYFIDSIGHYQNTELTEKWTSIGATLPNVVAGAGRCGGAAIEMGGVETLVKGIPFPTTTGIFGFAFRAFQQLFTGTGFAFFASPSGSGSHVYLTRANDGSISCWRSSPIPALLGSSAPDVIRLDNFYYVEFKATIDATAAGAIQVRVNGVVVLTATGVTQGDLSTDNTLSGVGIASGASATFYFCDVYVGDTSGPAPWNSYLGDVRVEYLRPDGPGAHQAWDLFGAATHWQAVDDGNTPDGDLTYILTATAGLIDTETYLPTGLPSGTIFGLQVGLRARKTDSGPRLLAPVLRHAGADYVGLDKAPSFPSYTYLLQLYTTNPGTGSPFTIADVNALEAGPKVTS